MHSKCVILRMVSSNKYSGKSLRKRRKIKKVLHLLTFRQQTKGLITLKAKCTKDQRSKICS